MLAVLIALATGCSTTQNKVHQFNAVPTAQVSSTELGPAKERTASELLRAANTEFRLGNKAQQEGDHKTALRHYSQMLEYMSEADLDPAVFEGLRAEFERVLSSNTETADLFEREYPDIDLTHRTTPSPLFAGNLRSLDRVQAEIDEIQRRYPKNFQAGLDRSWKYRARIEQELAAAGLPKELLWLAMVESQFHPNVVSRAGAVGMWQFMAATGRRYGLRIDNYVDERRHWEKATRAAAAYLRDLYTYHNGSWPLAVASYNMGEAGISRMVAMNGGERDIWQLISTPPASDHMPEETKKFYPKLAASWIVGTSPKSFGFAENRTPPENVSTVKVVGSYSLAALERSVNLPGGTLKKLNPHLIRGVTPPGEYEVVVPVDSVPQFTTAIASLSKEPRRGVSTVEGRKFHIVKKGDTISKIASAYGVSQQDIVDANKIRLSSRIPVGKKLLIPTAQEDNEKPAAPLQQEETVESTTASAPTPDSGVKTYRVQKGDTLLRIAQTHDVALENLQRWNNLDRHARIRVNQELIVSEPGAALAATESKTGETSKHVVKKGETLAEIAKQYDMKLDELLELNQLTRSSVIRVDDRLVVAKASGAESPVRGTNTDFKPSAPSKPASTELTGTHKVVGGDTLSKIAAKYGMKLKDLREANNLSANDVIKVGQTLKVKGGEKDSAKDSPVAVAAAGPENAAVEPAAKASGVESHVVTQGETLWDIASKYGCKVSDLVAWNNLADQSRLKIGQRLIVSTPKVANSSAAAPAADAPSGNGETKTIHKVTAGQSPASIAKRYGVKVGDVFKWNNWEKDHILHIGDEVIIYTK